MLIALLSMIPILSFAESEDAKSVSKEKAWDGGDVLIASSTIFAFFGFGSFFLFRIQNKEFFNDLIAVLGGILSSVFVIESCQMYIMFSVVSDQFNLFWYGVAMILSIIVFGIILTFTFVLIYMDSSVGLAKKSEDELETRLQRYSKSPVK